MSAIFLLSALSLETKAQDIDNDNDGLVEIHMREDVQEQRYIDARGAHSWLVGVSAENFKPSKFTSSLDGMAYGDALGGSAVMIPTLQVGYKMNFKFGAISLLGSYGTGSVESTSSGEKRRLSVEDTGVKAMLSLDTLWSEPYAVPYGAVGIYRLGLDESAPDAGLSDSHATGYGTETTLGLLLQLNWIEEEDSNVARLEAGLKNTFLNLYLSRYGGTQGSGDPDSSTDWQFGGGLVLEF